MKYLVSAELEHLARICRSLELAQTTGDLSLGNCNVADSNGDIVGYVGWTDAGEVGFIIKPDDD